MAFEKYGRGYFDPRTLYQIDSLYAWKNGLYFPPVVVEVNPTSLCNQRCRYCYVAGRTKGRLDDRVMKGLLPQLADAGVKAVVFQGTGEPLLHNSLPEAIEAGAERNLSMSLTTNGVLLDKEKKDRILKHLAYIKFSSLESAPERYAYLHGCAGKQFDAVVKNITDAVKLRERNGLDILFLATVYLYQDNFHEAYDIVRFWKGMGVDYVSIQEAVYNEYSYVGKEDLASDLFSDEEVRAMKDKVMTLMDNDFFVRIRFPLDDNSFTNGRFKDCWKDNWCQGIKFNTLINCDGEVYPCFRYWGMKDFSYGNICEKSFEEVWRGRKREDVEQFTNITPPQGDECSTCNVTKINDILCNLKGVTTNKWKDFLI